MWLVEGPTDFSGDTTIVGLHDPVVGRLATSAPPDSSLAGVAAELLRALGKRPEVAPALPTVATEPRWLRVWVEACAVEAVILHRADRCTPAVLTALDATVREAGATLYGVSDPLWVPALASQLATQVDGTLDHASFCARWPQVLPQPAATSAATDVPLDRAALRARLARAQAAPNRYDPAYLVGFTGAARFERPERPTAAALAASLRPLLARFDDPGCVAQAVHGAGAAQRPFGWDIRLDPRVLAQGEAVRGAAPGAEASYRSFWIFRDPLYGAAWVLTHLPATLDEVLAVRRADVADDGSMVAVQGEWYELPAEARPLLLAQALVRRLAGAAPEAPLLARPDRGPRDPAWLVRILRATAAEAGLRILDEALRHQPSEDERWLAERGVTLEWIPRTERATRVPSTSVLQDVANEVRDALADPEPYPACGCHTPHPPMRADEFSGWPPTRNHASTPYDTAIRRNAYGRKWRRE